MQVSAAVVARESIAGAWLSKFWLLKAVQSVSTDTGTDEEGIWGLRDM